MRLGACSREKELVELLKSGRWPAAADAELRSHVGGCRACREVVAVHGAMQGAVMEARAAAPLQTANVLWWRAQLRRRQEAVERVSRPLAGAQRFALMVNLAVMLVAGIWMARHAGAWRVWFAEAVVHGGEWTSLTQTLQNSSLTLLIPCAGAIALLGGVVVYLAADRS